MKHQWKQSLSFILFLSSICFACALLRYSRECYDEPIPSQIYIIPANIKEDQTRRTRRTRDADKIDTKSIVFNQGVPLNLPYEFLIDNPKLNVEQIKEIANEILPQGASLHNFVVMN